jgi:hypothetical protein
MGIVNINILTMKQQDMMHVNAQIALQEKLMIEHRRGNHTYGNMRRECPLCQQAA